MLEELKTTRETLEQEFKSLSDHEWIAKRLRDIKVQYDTLGNIIDKLEKEGEQNAPA